MHSIAAVLPVYTNRGETLLSLVGTSVGYICIEWDSIPKEQQ